MARRIGAFRSGFTRSPAITGNRRVRVISGAGPLYADNASGRLAQISGSLSLASNRYLQAVQMGADRLFIADCSPNLDSGTDGQRGSGNDKFDDAAAQDWTTLSLSTYDHVLEITAASGNLVNGVYAITAIGSTELTVSPNCATGVGGSCTYRILRGPKVFNYTAGTLARWAATTPSTGTMPAGCSLIAQHGNAIWLAGDPDNPHVWYKSQQNSAYVWDYTVEGAGAAVAGTSSDDGSPGQPITALVPFNNDILIMACRTELWAMRGDPSAGGAFKNISRSVGIVSPDAWCRGRQGEVFFLSTKGVQMMQGTAHPQAVSPGQLLLDLPADTVAAMAYDSADNGIHIYLESESLGGVSRHYWIDAETGAHFPMSFPSASRPVRAMSFDGEVLLGTLDGYLYGYDDQAERDGITAMSNYALIGPIMLGDGVMLDGILQELEGIVANDGGSVTWELYLGSSAEAAADAAVTGTSPDASGTFTAGRSATARVRRRQVAAVIKVAGVSSRRWGLEAMVAKRIVAGRHREG